MLQKSQNKLRVQGLPQQLSMSATVGPWLAGILVFLAFFHGNFCLAKPQRILSATLASDEMLTAILAASCEPRPCQSALARLVAVSRFADDQRYSNITAMASGIKGRFHGDVEQVVRFKPDLVILASFSRPEIISRLQSMQIAKFMMTDLVSIEAIESTIKSLGERIDEPEAAAKVVTEMKSSLALASEKGEKTRAQPSVLHIYDDGTISGRNTLFDAISTAAGATNAAHDLVNGWQKLSVEALLNLNPSFIVVGGTPNTSRDEESAKLKAIPGISKLAAWSAGRIIVIPDSELAAVSPHITKAVAKLKSALKNEPPVTEAQAK